MCIKPLKKGKLLLVPASLNIFFKTTDEASQLDPAGASICLGELTDDVTAWLGSSFIPEKGEKPGFISLVRTSHKEEDANMELSCVFGATDGNKQLKIPVLKNSKDLSEGEVLIRFVKRRAVEPEPLVPVPDGAATKRRRHAKGS